MNKYHLYHSLSTNFVFPPLLLLTLANKNPNNPVLRVKRERLLKLTPRLPEISHFSGLDLNGPSQHSRLVDCLSHTSNYLWLFYATFTFKMLRTQLV